MLLRIGQSYRPITIHITPQADGIGLCLHRLHVPCQISGEVLQGCCLSNSEGDAELPERTALIDITRQRPSFLFTKNSFSSSNFNMILVIADP